MVGFIALTSWIDIHLFFHSICKFASMLTVMLTFFFILKLLDWNVARCAVIHSQDSVCLIITEAFGSINNTG